MDIEAYETRFAGHLREIVTLDPRLLRRLMIEFRAIACEIEREALARGREDKVLEILRALGAAPAVRREPIREDGRTT